MTRTEWVRHAVDQALASPDRHYPDPRSFTDKVGNGSSLVIADLILEYRAYGRDSPAASFERSVQWSIYANGYVIGNATLNVDNPSLEDTLAAATKAFANALRAAFETAYQARWLPSSGDLP